MRTTALLQGWVPKDVNKFFREACALQGVEIGVALAEAASLWLEQKYLERPVKMEALNRKERVTALMRDGAMDLALAMDAAGEEEAVYLRRLVDAKIRNRCGENWDEAQLDLVKSIRSRGLPGYGKGVVPEPVVA